jgi:hypothetical protein
MTPQDVRALMERLVASLDRERDLLVAGDYATLVDEAGERQRALEQLERCPRRDLSAHAALLERVRDAGQRNERLLRAAADGAAAGRRRVREVLEARTQLASYDASGAPLNHAPAALGGRKA